MKYLALGLAAGCTWLSFFSTQAMEIVDLGDEHQEEAISIQLITVDQIFNYLAEHIGVNLKTIAQHVSQLDPEHQQIFANTLNSMLPLIGKGFDRLVNDLPSGTKITSVSKITEMLGIPAGKDPSKEALAFYRKSLNNQTTPLDTIITLAQKSDDIYAHILYAIEKILMNAVVQRKPFHGILLAHNDNQILVTEAPQQSSKFDKGFSFGLDSASGKNPKDPGALQTSSTITHHPIFNMGGSTPTGLNLAAELLKGLDAKLTDIENDPNTSPEEKACISKIHKPVIFVIAALSLVILAWQLYIGVEKVIHGNGNFSS